MMEKDNLSQKVSTAAGHPFWIWMSLNKFFSMPYNNKKKKKKKRIPFLEMNPKKEKTAERSDEG